jgi:predicted small metal-binding protein
MTTEKRYVADCREFPSEMNCSLSISGREEEVLNAAVDHAIGVHRHERTPQLREDVRKMLKQEVG